MRSSVNLELLLPAVQAVKTVLACQTQSRLHNNDSWPLLVKPLTPSSTSAPSPRVRFHFLSKFFAEGDKTRPARGQLKREMGTEMRNNKVRITPGARQPSAGFNEVISSVSQSWRWDSCENKCKPALSTAEPQCNMVTVSASGLLNDPVTSKHKPSGVKPKLHKEKLHNRIINCLTDKYSIFGWPYCVHIYI